MSSMLINTPMDINNKIVVAFFNYWKVGAPPELASLLEEIARESYPTDALREIGDDPELDEFMVFLCFLI